jgi:hypothetical protein
LISQLHSNWASCITASHPPQNNSKQFQQGTRSNQIKRAEKAQLRPSKVHLHCISLGACTISHARDTGCGVPVSYCHTKERYHTPSRGILYEGSGTWQKMLTRLLITPRVVSVQGFEVHLQSKWALDWRATVPCSSQPFLLTYLLLFIVCLFPSCTCASQCFLHYYGGIAQVSAPTSYNYKPTPHPHPTGPANPMSPKAALPTQPMKASR